MFNQPINALLVEDNPTEAKLVKAILAKGQVSNFNLHWENTLRGALRRIEQGGIEVILLDLGLPDSQGLETFREVQYAAPQAPIVVWTADENEQLAHEVRAAGAQDFILKTQDLPALSRCLCHAVEKQRLLIQLRHLSINDALTGLPNRTLFLSHLERALIRSRRNPKYGFAVIVLDLDRFKVINDSVGHRWGDELLIEVSRRLREAVRASDVICRLGGDEFAIYLEDIPLAGDAIDIANRIQSGLAAPLRLGEKNVFTSASIGVAMSHPSYQDAGDVLRDADTAMHRAKAEGRGRHQLFDSEMHADALARMQLEQDLRLAVERGEFRLVYQPIYRLCDRQLAGFEALVRWPHPTRGLIPPLDFIPLAEEIGLIVQLDRWVLRAACQQMAHWQARFPAACDLRICVNISRRQLAEPDFVDLALAVVRDTGLATGSLELEITESAVMEKVETAANHLTQLNRHGVSLSIDDFGTGYSSLSHLHQFPFHTLKIDRSFVGRMHEDEGESEVFVQAMVTLAQHLGGEVVAEGIESEAQLAMLEEAQCEYGQGYLFSKPLDPAAAETLVARHAVSAERAPARTIAEPREDKREREKRATREA